MFTKVKMTPLASMGEWTTFTVGGYQFMCFQGTFTQGFWKIEKTSNLLLSAIFFKFCKIVRGALRKWYICLNCVIAFTEDRPLLTCPYCSQNYYFCWSVFITEILQEPLYTWAWNPSIRKLQAIGKGAANIMDLFRGQRSWIWIGVLKQVEFSLKIHS